MVTEPLHLRWRIGRYRPGGTSYELFYYSGRLDPSDPGKTTVLLGLEESFPERLHT
jgi:hypothetical protein